MTHRLKREITLTIDGTSDDFRFAVAVAAYGMQLKNSPYKGNTSYDMIAYYAQNALGKDPNRYRRAFLRMVKSAKELVI